MASMPLSSSPSELVARLEERLARLEQPARPSAGEVVSTGCGELDRLLPRGGLQRGTLVEWLAPGGSGAGSLALAAAGAACREGGLLVVMDTDRQFYPPAAVAAGIDLAQLMLVQPAPQDEVWAVDQTLRAQCVAAVLHWGSRNDLSDRTLRRWQLAAEAGGGLGLLVLPPEARQRPSWAGVRWWVEPVPQCSTRRMRLTQLRFRGSAEGRSFEVELDDETGAVRLVSELGAATARHRARGAS